MGEAQGKKVDPPPLRHRGAAVLWPDQAIRGRAARGLAANPKEKTWRISLAQGVGLLGAEKETPACRWTAAGCRDQTGQRLKTIDWRGLRRRAWSKPTRDRTQVMRGDQRDRLAWAHFRDGKFAPRRSATLADEAMPDWQQRPARHRAGERATCALWPSPRRWSRPQLQ